MAYRITTWIEVPDNLSKEDARKEMLRALHMREDSPTVDISIESLTTSHEFPRRG